MYVRQLQVTDFRSWSNADLALDPGITVFIGANGQGKTNLVEAIGYVAALSSHRVSSDAPLVRDGASRAVVRAAVVNGGRELLVELEITPGKANRARINRGAAGKPRDVLGILRTVLFAPEDLSILRGDPGERRRFMDELLVARYPRFAAVRSDYERVLKQRSALLKSAGAARRGSSSSGDLATLEVWDGHLARFGAQLLAGRLDLIAALAPHVTSAYASVAATGADSTPAGRVADVRYRSSLGDALSAEHDPARGGTADPEALERLILDELGRVRQQELERGVSLIGPHRDDLELLLGELPTKGYASHGESWSFVLALRLASYHLLTEDGAEPVLILDDVFAELDRRRRSRLAELVSGAEQVLVTAAVPEDVPEELHGGRFDVGEGEVSRAS